MCAFDRQEALPRRALQTRPYVDQLFYIILSFSEFFKRILICILLYTVPKVWKVLYIFFTKRGWQMHCSFFLIRVEVYNNVSHKKGLKIILLKRSNLFFMVHLIKENISIKIKSYVNNGSMFEFIFIYLYKETHYSLEVVIHKNKVIPTNFYYPFWT